MPTTKGFQTVSYYILYGLLYGLSLLPFSVLYGLSDFVCFIVYRVVGYRREIIYRNLKNAFPEKSEAEIQKVAGEFYRYFCDLFLEMFKTLSISRKSMLRHCQMTPESLALFKQLETEGRSAILVLGHYGNWEWAGNTFSLLCGQQLYVIYHPLSSAPFDRLMYKMRVRFGTGLTDMRSTFKTMLQLRDRVTMTAFIADQTPQPDRAHWMTFLHQDTPVFMGTETIARKLNYPVVYGSVHKIKRGYYEIRASLLVDQPADTHEGEISEIHTRKLESDINEYPSTWLWSHRRWKHRKPILPHPPKAQLTGRELILSTKEYARESPRSSWAHTLITLVLLVMALTSTLVAPLLILRIASSIFAGLLVIRFFIIYHDFQHHTILYKSKVADVVMTIFGLYILVPPSIWKRSHDYHHNHNSKLFSADIGSYPIVTKNQFLSMERKDRISYLAIRHPLTILFGYITMFLFGMCIKSLMNNPRRHLDSLVALIVHIGGSIVIWMYFGWEGWLLFVVIPLFIGDAIGAYLFYAQHNFPGVVFKDRCGWTYEGAAMESSSYMKMSGFMRWCTGNIGFHHIHHLNSRIPFYNLPKAMKGIVELQRAKTTSLRWRDIRSCLRLKVWDPETMAMVGFKEIYAASACEKALNTQTSGI